MHFKKDFRSRLERLNRVIDSFLVLDDSPEGFCSPLGLFPCFFYVYSSLWGKRPEDLIKK